MLDYIDLQLFAEGGEKTEEPTPKKRRDAREEGQVVQSKEVNTVVILFACFLGIKFLGKILVNELYKFMIMIFNQVKNTDLFLSENNLMINFLKVTTVFTLVTLPILLISFLAALLVNYLQVGFLFTSKTLKIKLDRLNPIEGFKRIFSKRGIMELVKSILKLGLVGFIAYKYALGQMTTIVKYPNMEITYFFMNFCNLLFEFMKRMLGVLLVLALMDYFFQWRTHEKNLKMTKQEIKEEFKQTEGDPFIKGKIKEKQRQMAMSRMMQDLPKADVVITNPTHYAVAIRYEPDLVEAPYVVAKGVDNLAQNIKKIARENDVVIVENRLLARTLYETLEIKDLIPEELYEAVAEVLAYVYSLKGEI